MSWNQEERGKEEHWTKWNATQPTAVGESSKKPSQFPAELGDPNDECSNPSMEDTKDFIWKHSSNLSEEENNSSECESSHRPLLQEETAEDCVDAGSQSSVNDVEQINEPDLQGFQENRDSENQKTFLNETVQVCGKVMSLRLNNLDSDDEDEKPRF